MKKLAIVAVCLFLWGCGGVSTSETIATHTKEDIKAIGQTVERLEKQTPSECKTDAFVANLRAIETQVSAMVGRVDSISESCQVEKQVLNEKITNREIIIFAFILALIGYLFLKIRK